MNGGDVAGWDIIVVALGAVRDIPPGKSPEHSTMVGSVVCWDIAVAVDDKGWAISAGMLSVAWVASAQSVARNRKSGVRTSR
jgi:hypothetical protein